MTTSSSNQNNNKNGSSSSGIVCIGASAGGLEAIERFFQDCPDDLGVSYVVVQHLSSHYKSMMDDLINRYTSMNVVMIDSGCRPKPNTIYLIEAGTTIKLIEGRFAVEKKPDGELSLPIDIFLQSLADSEVENAIAVILSGTGSDGSRGCMAVNAHGGFVIAQTPEDAGFDGMPNSVISTGIVDDIREANRIPLTISKYLQAGFVARDDLNSLNQLNSAQTVQEETTRILSKLHRDYGIDFSHYKEATIVRRIERRMQVKHISNYKNYADLVDKDPVEPLSLRRELLIPVTNFFRDSSVFEELRSLVLAKLIDQDDQSEEIRIWVAGCSTGEEPYSLMILLTEEMRRLNIRRNVKIFATDVNPDIIDIATKGQYPENIRSEVPDKYLEQYFIKSEDGYTIAPSIRQQIVFAVHNLLTDAPFTKMDMVSCRNTLIYFKNDAQKEVLKRLQYAVKLKGFLLLGKSESLNVNEEHFDVLDRMLKIFQCIKKTDAAVNSLNFTASKRRQVGLGMQTEEVVNSAHIQAELHAEAQIRKIFTPLSLLVNHEHEVVHIFGDKTDLLRIKPGNISYSISNLLPEKLSPVASALLYRLNKEDGFVTSDSVNLSDPSGATPRTIRLKGWVVEQEGPNRHFVLCFLEGESDRDDAASGQEVDLSQAQSDRIRQLELELTATRESLQSTIEELETTNEELQATNEELMASNEELQSSNEELQSVNEELNTVNAEYHEKMSILNRINADLDAMSRSTGIATLFVDNGQHLTRFTPDASEIFKVRDQDLGRPLDEIVNSLNYDRLYDDINLTLTTGRSKEIEVLGNEGQVYLLRIVAYKLPSIDSFGAAISLIESKNFGSFQRVMDAIPEHVAVLDEQGNIVLVNQAWQRFAIINSDGRPSASLGVGANYLEVCGCDDSANDIVQGIKKVLTGEQIKFSAKYPCHSPTEKRWFIMEVRTIQHDYYRAVITHFNVTQWET